jgi:SAM-dependent methyltransferase
MLITQTKIATKLRKLAEAMPDRIANLRRPMTQNSTPKRQREYASRCIDGDNMERGRLAMLALADAWDAGNVPEILHGIKTKDEICRLVRHGTDSTGYYSAFSTHKYADTSEAGKALQAILDASMGKETQEQQEATKRQRQLEAMIDRIRFCDIPGFFPTPQPVIEVMLQHADIQPGMSILEPSAGIGSIADAARQAGGKVECWEINHTLADILIAKDYAVDSGDFLEETKPCVGTLFEDQGPRHIDERFDRVLMNPPFERGQDMDHVRHAFTFLKPGGKLVAIVSNGPFFRQEEKAVAFREWLEETGAEVIDMPEGSFSGAAAFRSTGIACKMLVIRKGN